ncbi:MAG: hypothetical protein HEQ16_00510 [Bosea sp.]|jgi:hypothetical protein|nr:hypothetical protein [Bosea sp. (in: a-proteobacteria)]
MIHQLQHALGWRLLSTGDIVFILGMAGAVFLILAWLADILMGRLSFGLIVNTLLMMVGAFLGLAVMVWLGFPPTRRDFLPTVFVCGTSGVLMLMLFAAFRRAA